MQITLTPMRRDDRLVAERHGDVLVLNGIAYDFTQLPEGAILPREAVDCGWLASDVVRTGGRLQLTLVLPHGAGAPPETLFPAPLTAPADGPLPLPAYDAPPADPPAEDPPAEDPNPEHPEDAQ